MRAVKESNASKASINVDGFGKTRKAAVVSVRSLGAAGSSLADCELTAQPLVLYFYAGSSKPVLVLDVGANVECRPKFLEQFAVMGTIYSRYVLVSRTPRWDF